MVAVSEGRSFRTRPFQAVIEVDLLDTYPIGSQEVPADQSTPQGQECLVDVGPFFVANAQSAELVEPCEGSFHHPAPSSQSTAMFYVSLGEHRLRWEVKQTLADCLRVITTVA